MTVTGATEPCARIVAAHPRLGDVTPQAVREKPFALADAQLVIAREYGFDSWPKMQRALFTEEQHFANEPGWEYRGLPRLEVHFAVDERHAQRQLRVVGFDEEARRYLCWKRTRSPYPGS